MFYRAHIHQTLLNWSGKSTLLQSFHCNCWKCNLFALWGLVFHSHVVTIELEPPDVVWCVWWQVFGTPHPLSHSPTVLPQRAPQQALFTVLLFIFLLGWQVIFGKHNFRTFRFVFIASFGAGLNFIKDNSLTNFKWFNWGRPYLNISTTGWGSCHVDLLRRSWSSADFSSRLWWSPKISTTLLVQYVYCWGHLLKFIVSSPVLSP